MKKTVFLYTYDNLNRLTSANYGTDSEDEILGALALANERDYSCSYAYDLNGNISSIMRKGVKRKLNVFDMAMVQFGKIDDMSLEYNGNQLKKVTDQCDNLTYEGAMDFKDGADQSTEYAYDANGNMTRDRNKGIHSITYNMLNLPQIILFNDGHETRYTYAADGRKLRVQYLLNNFAIFDGAAGCFSVAFLGVGYPSFLWRFKKIFSS
ncbi:MAG: hypothetical protein Q4E41_09085 [Bacteroidales bacterium]|nr:hypothetical protein [Bacteroidales bacterium]